MNEEEYKDCLAYMDPVEIIMRANKARAQSNKEDTIACAIAEGFRMGWEAHKKKMEEQV